MVCQHGSYGYSIPPGNDQISHFPGSSENHVQSRPFDEICDRSQEGYVTHRIHVTGIFTYIGSICMGNVGKYTSHMDSMGYSTGLDIMAFSKKNV